MWNFLVRIAVLERRLLAAAEGDHRAAAEPCVLQTRGQVGGTDRLRHAHARPPGDAGIAVGHVGRSLLRVGKDRPYPEIAQVQQGAAQRRLDEEDMTHPGPGQGPRQPFGAVHRGCFAHAVSSALTMPMQCSRRLGVRDQAPTRLGEVLTRAERVPHWRTSALTGGARTRTRGCPEALRTPGAPQTPNTPPACRCARPRYANL